MAHARQLSLNERRRRQKAREAARFNTMLKEIADAFSCSTRIATDFADQCELNRDNLEAFVREVPGVLEVSIGHALIADALELGYAATVRAYQACIDAVCS